MILSWVIFNIKLKSADYVRWFNRPAQAPRPWDNFPIRLKSADYATGSAGDFFHDEGFEDVAYLNIIAFFETDTAFVAGSHFAHVILETAE